MFLARLFLDSVCLNQVSLFQGFLLLGIHDQYMLMSRLKRTTAIQKQANGSAVFAGFDFDHRRHGCLLGAVFIPQNNFKLTQPRKEHQPSHSYLRDPDQQVAERRGVEDVRVIDSADGWLHQ
jgi:hypothetical protein